MLYCDTLDENQMQNVLAHDCQDTAYWFKGNPKFLKSQS